MKIIKFKFDLGDKVTTADGDEGIITSLIHRKTLHDPNCNLYEVLFKKKTKYNKLYFIFKENELLKGHNLFHHQKL